jgi:hypothetical protein
MGHLVCDCQRWKFVDAVGWVLRQKKENVLVPQEEADEYGRRTCVVCNHWLWPQGFAARVTGGSHEQDARDRADGA